MSSYAYPNPQAIFYQQYEAVRRDEVVGILLALFLGSFGLHHFYLRRTGLGILYLCFCWTGDSAISRFDRVLLHARPGARVQCHPGGGDCGGAGHSCARLGSACEWSRAMCRRGATSPWPRRPRSMPARTAKRPIRQAHASARGAVGRFSKTASATQQATYSRGRSASTR